VDLQEFIGMQREFDAKRETKFSWSQAVDETDPSPLVHNVLALAGEIGELANLVKKYQRGDFSFAQLNELMPGELADIFIYLLKLAYQSGIDLEKAFLDKLAQNEIRFESARRPTYDDQGQ
jgi:NTP pyrophosphatase (non-canonical NTP hydrolase)